ncbi:hypothetical protein WK78_29725 [Burkholderia cepacia]|nr:hypothetical protein WK78_29725 [Burkholderia cepacia]
MLWDTIVGAVYNLNRDLVMPLQGAEEFLKYWMPFELGYVFHCYEVGFQLLSDSTKFAQHRPALIF